MPYRMFYDEAESTWCIVEHSQGPFKTHNGAKNAIRRLQRQSLTSALSELQQAQELVLRREQVLARPIRIVHPQIGSFTAIVRFSHHRSDPEAHFLIGTSFPDDPSRWDMIVRPLIGAERPDGDSNFFANIQSLSPEAPLSKLYPGVRLNIFHGPHSAGSLTVMTTARLVLHD